MTALELLPCPFCGGGECYEANNEIGLPMIVCPVCAACGPAKFSAYDWNTRTKPTPDALRLAQAALAERTRELQAARAELENLRDKVERLNKSLDWFKENGIQTYQAMSAMRDSINEYVPMPSVESDLLQGPENSVFCETVATAIIAHLTAAPQGGGEA